MQDARDPGASGDQDQSPQYGLGADGVGVDEPTLRRRRRWPLILIVAFVLLAAGGGVVAWYVQGPLKNKEYLTALNDADLNDTYANDEVAVAQAKAYCEALSGGKRPRGYASDKVSVEHYCPQFLQGFEVVPTPAEVRHAYLTEVRDKGLGGKFASDAAAVASAKATCERLGGGAAQEGTAVDAIGVKHYCDSFNGGFHVLEKANVKGSFTLFEFDPSIYFPSITEYGTSCQGSNGFDDVYPGTEVLVKSGDGKLLTRATLGEGSGDAIVCEFTFSFEVMEGHDDYVVSVGQRGESHYTFEQLRNNGVHLELG